MPHGMTLEQMEAEARLSEMRVEALQQLTSALSGSRIYLPHAGHGTPQQLVWSSPTYGAGQQLMPDGLHAEVLHPGDSNNDGRNLVGRDHGQVELSASEQQPMTVGQESFHALARGPPDRSTIFAVKRDESRGPDSIQRMPRESQAVRDIEAYRAAEAAQAAAWAASGFAFPGFPASLPDEHVSDRISEPEYLARQPQVDHRQTPVSSDAMHCSMASAQHSGGGVAFQPTRQSTCLQVDVGMAGQSGPALVPQQTQSGPQLYGQDRLAQPTIHVARPADKQYGGSPVYTPSPMLTPIPPFPHDPMRHLQWLQEKFDAVLATSGDPVVLGSIMQQIQTTTTALHGIATPPRGVDTGGDGRQHGSPGYKRDLTPVGQRHTPVDTAKYIYDKGEPAKVDPKAAAAHARNSKTRVRVRDPLSD
jgi:hypothetical protein